MDTPLHYQPAHVLQDLINAGCLTSELLVEELMDRIARHAEGLKTFISLAPRESVIRQAKILDEERDRGHVRSDLHGIPIVVKDIVGTDPSLGMTTSAGVAAFRELKAKKNSVLAQRLMDAGMIILGKTNMTELCGLKYVPMRALHTHLLTYLDLTTPLSVGPVLVASPSLRIGARVLMRRISRKHLARLRDRAWPSAPASLLSPSAPMLQDLSSSRPLYTASTAQS